MKLDESRKVMTPNGIATAISTIYIDLSRGAKGLEPEGLYVRHPKGAHLDESKSVKFLGSGKGLGHAAIYKIDDCQPANGLPGIG